MSDFLSSFYGQGNSGTQMQGNFSQVTPSFNAANLYSTQDAFSSSLLANGGVDTLSGSNSIGGQGGGSWMDNILVNKDGGAGWGASALGAGLGLAQTFLGFSQLSEGKKQNKIAQQQWQSQFDIQKEEYDRRVSERQARIANANAAKANAKGG